VEQDLLITPICMHLHRLTRSKTKSCPSSHHFTSILHTTYYWSFSHVARQWSWNPTALAWLWPSGPSPWTTSSTQYSTSRPTTPSCDDGHGQIHDSTILGPASHPWTLEVTMHTRSQRQASSMDTHQDSRPWYLWWEWPDQVTCFHLPVQASLLHLPWRFWWWWSQNNLCSFLAQGYSTVLVQAYPSTWRSSTPQVHPPLGCIWGGPQNHLQRTWSNQFSHAQVGQSAHAGSSQYHQIQCRI